MSNFLLNTIKHLREKEDVLLYCNLLMVSNNEIDEVGSYLENQYLDEAIGYPGDAPKFDKNAAVWAAKVIYLSSQLLLNRVHKIDVIEELMPKIESKITPSEILSADLCLRFLPDILKQLKVIDPEDQLIGILETILVKWHYSGVNYLLKTDLLDFEVVLNNSCLKQLYVDRVIEYQNIELAQKTELSGAIEANLGIFKEIFWENYHKKEIIKHERN